VPATCVCCSTEVDWWVRLRSHPDQPICHGCLDGLNAQRDGQLQLIAGTWLVRGFHPILVVADMARSVDWYEGAGFEVSTHGDSYGFAHRDKDLTIHLSVATGDEVPGHGSVYIFCQDVDQVAAAWSGAGLTVDGPHDFDHGRREATARDPDGNLLRVGSPLR
jgi:catechol 2,3-dioxygenase-like lactoylglutathione lyase family enzyme